MKFLEWLLAATTTVKIRKAYSASRRDTFFGTLAEIESRQNSSGLDYVDQGEEFVLYQHDTIVQFKPIHDKCQGQLVPLYRYYNSQRNDHTIQVTFKGAISEVCKANLNITYSSISPLSISFRTLP